MTRVIEFKDKVVVITGAGGVLCGYLAKEFAKAGAKVALLDLNQAAAQVLLMRLLQQEVVPRLTNLMSFPRKIWKKFANRYWQISVR